MTIQPPHVDLEHNDGLCRNIVIPISGTFRPRGGMTGSVLAKASFLAELGHNVKLVTFRYRLDQREHAEELVELNLLSPKVNFINFYEEMQKNNSRSIADVELKSMRTPLVVQRQNEKLTRYFSQSGDLKFTELLIETPVPHYIRRFYDLDLTMLRLEELDIDKRLRRVKRFKPGVETPLVESFIAETGEAFLTVWYRPDGSVRSVIDLQQNPDHVNPEYNSLDSMKSRWFTTLVEGENEPIIMVDDPYSVGLVEQSLGSASKRILTLHSNTYVDPSDPQSGINRENQRLFKLIDRFEIVVTSTKMQSFDLKQQYPNAHFRNIPQLVRSVNDKTLSTMVRDRNLIVFVGRLEPIKQLEQLLDAIVPLFAVNPDARFEIYGQGSQESALRSKIKKLGLENFVKLMGSTSFPLREMARATLTVLPSRLEGFGLTIAESMSVGTPVVSFNCRYGPADMIEDKVSGHLIDPQDFVGMVTCLEALLSDPLLVEGMRVAASRSISKLCDPDFIVESWNEIIKS